jgi:KEOPS complex subunit Pcc1
VTLILWTVFSLSLRLKMKCCADLVFSTDDANDIFQALRPELEDDLRRSRTSLALDHGFIRLRIEGDDIVSIRAALNTWVRLIKITFEMANV